MSHELNCDIGTTGLTVTATLLLGSTVVVSGIACPDSLGIGYYSGDMPAEAANTYIIRFVSSGNKVGGGKIVWDGTKEVTNLVLQNDIASITAGGSGSDTIYFHVTDLLGNNLQGALVTILNNGIVQDYALTGADGFAHIALNPATYEVNVVCNGFTSLAAQILTVAGSGSETVGYTLTSLGSLPTSVTGLVTMYTTCIDTDTGLPLAGVVHTLTTVKLPESFEGLTINTSVRTCTSVSGVNNVTFNNIVPGGKYTLQRANGPLVYFEGQEQNFSPVICGATT